MSPGPLSGRGQAFSFLPSRGRISLSGLRGWHGLFVVRVSVCDETRGQDLVGCGEAVVITFLLTSSTNVVFRGGGSCLLGRGGRRVLPDVPFSPFRIFSFCSPWRSAPVCSRCFTLNVSGREGVCRRSPGGWSQISSPPCRGRISLPLLVVRGVLVGC